LSLRLRTQPVHLSAWVDFGGSTTFSATSIFPIFNSGTRLWEPSSSHRVHDRKWQTGMPCANATLTHFRFRIRQIKSIECGSIDLNSQADHHHHHPLLRLWQVGDLSATPHCTNFSCPQFLISHGPGLLITTKNQQQGFCETGDLFGNSIFQQSPCTTSNDRTYDLFGNDTLTHGQRQTQNRKVW